MICVSRNTTKLWEWFHTLDNSFQATLYQSQQMQSQEHGYIWFISSFCPSTARFWKVRKCWSGCWWWCLQSTSFAQLIMSSWLSPDTLYRSFLQQAVIKIFTSVRILSSIFRLYSIVLLIFSSMPRCLRDFRKNWRFFVWELRLPGPQTLLLSSTPASEKLRINFTHFHMLSDTDITSLSFHVSLFWLQNDCHKCHRPLFSLLDNKMV